jgi:branched-chain amino acid transport system substrate-binding protein
VATANPKPTTVAVLAADDSFSQEVAKGAVDYAQAKGLQIVYKQKYPNGSTNLYNLVNEVKAKSGRGEQGGHGREGERQDVCLLGRTVPDFVKALGTQADFVVTGSQWTAQAQYKSDYLPDRDPVRRRLPQEVPDHRRAQLPGG